MIAIWVSVVGCSRTVSGPHEGQHGPNFNAPLMSGGEAEFARFRGKPTMVVFWASWCGPCRKEAPQIVDVYRQYGSAINVVGINAGESTAVAQRAAAEMGIKWPVLMDSDGAIQRMYKVSGIPLVLILDAEGVVRHRNNGVPSNVHRLIDGLMK